MMRSLYSGVSGLKTHQVKMDVIGNNIANVNTVAYKSQSITFSELMYQTTQKASGPNEATGTAGKNAKQIGLGVSSGAISTAITTQGSTQTTGNAFDLKITGNSFFIVNDGSTNSFTRDGSFYVDAAGNLAMSSTGYNVMGWLPREDPNTGVITIVQDTVKKLQILSEDNMVSPPQATKKATIAGVLDKNDPNVQSTVGKSVNLSFYDNLGYTYTAKYNVKATDAEGEYVLSLSDVLNSNNESILDKYSATIFSGTDSEGSATYAAKTASYSLGDGYKMETFPTLTIGNDPTAYTPTNFLEKDATTGAIKIKAGQEEAAAKYAEAFGYDDPEQFFNLTVLTDVKNNTYTTIGQVLLNGGEYEVTDADGNKTKKSLYDDTKKAINVDGYSTSAGTSIKVKYDQATGKFVGIDGNNTKTGFSMMIKPVNPADENAFEQVDVDMSSSLNYNNEKTSTLTAKSGDSQGFNTGCALGAMTGVSIQNNGMIYGAYDNGQTKLLGQIAVASFSNAMGLEKDGDNLYKATLNSGEFDGIGIDITSDGGYMSTGVLEMSNVDLSSEFTEMITTQRGFQANSRIITVSDTLLEELVNLKR